MKRPLLIAVLLFIALAAAPACTIKERAKPQLERINVSEPISPVSSDQVMTGGQFYLLFYLPARSYGDDFSNDLML